MHAGHHHVQLGQQGGLLIEIAVVEDVHLDPLQHTETVQPSVEFRGHPLLLAQPLGTQPVGDGESRVSGR